MHEASLFLNIKCEMSLVPDRSEATPESSEFRLKQIDKSVVCVTIHWKVRTKNQQISFSVILLTETNNSAK